MSKEYIKYFSSSSDMENFYVINVPFSAYNAEQLVGYFSTRPGILNIDGTTSNPRMITYTTSDNKKLSVIDSEFSDISFHEYNDCGVVIFNSDFTSGLQNISFGSTLTSINLPDGVWIINNAFTDTSITEIHIPKRCHSINRLFDSSDTLKVITVDKENLSFVANDNVLFSKNMDALYRYAPGKPQTDYIIPPTVVSIKGCAFDSCTSLKSVSIPDSVTSVEYSAFEGCTSLTINTIPDSITTIGGRAFYGINATIPVYNAHFFVYMPPTAHEGRYVIPYGIQTICDHAFSDSTTVTSVTIPNSVTSIKYEAFSGCSSLTSITIPNSVTSIGLHAFLNCSSLTSVDIPNSITSIEYGAFSGCSSLTSVTIPNSVTSIEWAAFYGCSSLTSIVIPDSVTSIAGNTFNKCTSLQTVDLQPTSVLSIDFAALLLLNARTVLVPHNLVDSYKSTYSDYASKFKSNYTPLTCVSLQITADDVLGYTTSTTIYWQAVTNGVDSAGNIMLGITIEGTTTSEEFEQNTTEEDITRTITFTYLDVTATTEIVQSVRPPKFYTVDLNSQWRLSTTVSNPDSSLYDGVYESFSNKGVNSQAATMYIDIDGYDDFTVYIRSYAESSYDYVMISQPDMTIDNNTSYSNTSYVKQYTRGYLNSGTSIGSYRTASYTGLGGAPHRITVVYRKDSGGYSGDDRGYVLIPKNQ